MYQSAINILSKILPESDPELQLILIYEASMGGYTNEVVAEIKLKNMLQTIPHSSPNYGHLLYW